MRFLVIILLFNISMLFSQDIQELKKAESLEIVNYVNNDDSSYMIKKGHSLESLPSPYNSLNKLLPYHCWGWFGNQRMLTELFDAINPQIIVEVGCWLGESAIFIAEHSAAKLYAVDHWLGSVEHQNVSLVKDGTLYDQFLSNVIHRNLTHKIVPVREYSLKAAEKFNVEADLVYIDASHDTESVLADIYAWFPKLSKKGVLCGDDFTWPSVKKALEIASKELNVEVKGEGNFWSFIRK